MKRIKCFGVRIAGLLILSGSIIRQIDSLKLANSFLQSQINVVFLLILLSLSFRDVSFLSLKVAYTPIIYTYFFYHKTMKTFILSGFLDGICSEVLKLLQIERFAINSVSLCLYLLFLILAYLAFLKYVKK
ncbi:hypothetical protein BVE84_07920 [Streptococcus azizii]|uniref:Uncharacterized protein n=1 Tax=Streptococcus azizii TaxID=1579424 RepID=A0AB36JS05_9STRE|nr:MULTISPECIES: hypothetical protein [Streptococcus]MBF0776630.1 hypothetical protein [Streptococcus sp. 19428wD3_AN2]ONK26191.1 hypothetical protein BVE86_08080 [Streptococcus azizii]ONK26691.1 hypothetical protein BVE85_07960 [Streptococcus azizii]ONK27602.1 hypothetical protein BVE84_07920 [Streptococcus azizii]TFU82725.1 hypothetical protein E4T83_07665 [Streptococcus sp. AN2]